MAADFWNGDNAGAFLDKRYGKTGDENGSEEKVTKCTNNGSTKKRCFGEPEEEFGVECPSP